MCQPLPVAADVVGKGHEVQVCLVRVARLLHLLALFAESLVDA